MRILHVFKTYLPETVGGIEQVIYQICQSGIAHGIESHVLTLSAAPEPRDLMLADHHVHRAKLDLQLASTGFSYSVRGRLKALAAEADVVNYHFPWPYMDMLHFAARREHVVRSIRPMLAAGAWVICDRFADSTLAYQGAGRDLDASQIRDLSLFAVEGLLPHLTILLDLEASAALARRLEIWLSRLSNSPCSPSAS